MWPRSVAEAVGRLAVVGASLAGGCAANEPDPRAPIAAAAGVSGEPAGPLVAAAHPIGAGTPSGPIAAGLPRPADEPLFTDCHVHLTDYVQHGPSPKDLLDVMGSKVHRATLFGIPLQQQWSFRISGDAAPTYYLDSDAPLYYYSFADAAIAEAYRRLSPGDRRRFYPMITAFNPADMYAAEHIRRVLLTYPGVFVGIGEFTIHKEFVSSKIAGETPSLTDPALDRVLALAEEVGLAVLIHNDLDRPFADDGAPPAHLQQIVALFKRHPKATIIWAHAGLGRVIHPIENHVALLARLLDDPALRHVNFDISWREVAKYMVATEDSIRRSAALLDRYPDRFVFGTDTVGPRDPAKYLSVYEEYLPVLDRLRPESRRLITRLNCERLLDRAHDRTRAWERAQRTVR